MPFYNIEGADEKTGKDRLVNVLAHDEREAAAQAKTMGLLVSAVYPAIAANQEEARTRQFPKAVMEANIAPPDYAGLLAARLVYIAYAIFGLGVGFFFLVKAIVAFVMEARQGGPVDYTMTKDDLVWFAASMCGGAILLGSASACMALRDIARNSFKPHR